MKETLKEKYNELRKKYRNVNYSTEAYLNPEIFDYFKKYNELGYIPYFVEYDNFIYNTRNNNFIYIFYNEYLIIKYIFNEDELNKLSNNVIDFNQNRKNKIDSIFCT